MLHLMLLLRAVPQVFPPGMAYGSGFELCSGAKLLHLPLFGRPMPLGVIFTPVIGFACLIAAFFVPVLVLMALPCTLSPQRTAEKNEGMRYKKCPVQFLNTQSSNV